MKSNTAQYLVKKQGLEESIKWYNTTILAVDVQQATRRRQRDELVDDLYKLEREYYGA